MAVNEKILDGLSKKAKAFAASKSLPLAHQNFPLEKPATKFLRANILLNKTQNYSIGSGVQQNRGMYQLSIFWPSAEGLSAPLALADEIISYFDKNTIIHEDGVRIEIYEKPYAASALQEANLVQIPVTIAWQSFNS